MDGYQFDYYTLRSFSTRYDGLPFLGVYVLFAAILGGIIPNHWWPDAGLFMFIPLFGHILFHLGTHWSVQFRCKICFDVTSIENATHILVLPSQESRRKAQIVEKRIEPDGKTSMILEQRKLINDPDTGLFNLLQPPIDGPVKEYQQKWKDGGCTTQASLELRRLYGRNVFAIPLPKFSELFAEHVVSPFFVFQMFCVLLWLMDDYWYYSILTAVLLIILECQLIKRRLVDLQELRNMRVPPRLMQVWRNKSWLNVSSDHLVPGDIISLSRSRDNQIPCDVLMLQGTVLCDEAMLTGESAPQLKVAIEESNEKLDIEGVHKQHLVYGGTKIVLHRNPDQKDVPNQGCVGYVLRTGFSPRQGSLVRTILFSSERVTVSSKDAAYFLITLLFFALLASGYTLYDGLTNVEDAVDKRRSTFKLIVTCSRILTSVVPPEFPITLSLAVTLSLLQLVRAQIFCTEPFRVPLCGQINVCCFDKTGTLTSEDFSVSSIESKIKETSLVLGVCHSLAQVDGAPVGDPLEKAALQSGGATLSTTDDLNEISFPSSEDYKSATIIKRHPFSSELKRMCVMARIHTVKGEKKYMALVKGAPEVIQKRLISPPPNLLSEAKRLARKGLRVITLGFKEIKENETGQSSRDTLEKGLTFAGLLCLEANIKPNTTSTLKQLKQSSHRLVMITGDHPLTAIQVAKDVGIIDKKVILRLQDKRWVKDSEDNVRLSVSSAEGASTTKNDDEDSISVITMGNRISRDVGLCAVGPELDKLDADEFKDVIKVADVFARISPQQKEKIILRLNEDNITLMAGDGTNDVGALKAAHCGVSILSQSYMAPVVPRQQHRMDEDGPPMVSLGDASIASPFTSKKDNIRCTLALLRAGRSTLSTVMMMYKIMALNSLMSALSMSVLACDGVKLGDGQTAIESVAISFCFFLVSKTSPCKKLHTRRPVTSVREWHVILSLLLQLIIHAGTLIVGWNLARAHRELPFTRDLDGDFAPNIVNTVVFLLLSCQHVSSFTANYEGAPFLQGMHTNKPLSFLIGGFCWTLTMVALEGLPELGLNDSLSLVRFPTAELKSQVGILLLIDFFGSTAVGHSVRLLAGYIEDRKMKIE